MLILVTLFKGSQGPVLLAKKSWIQLVALYVFDTSCFLRYVTKYALHTNHLFRVHQEGEKTAWEQRRTSRSVTPAVRTRI